MAYSSAAAAETVEGGDGNSFFLFDSLSISDSLSLVRALSRFLSPAAAAMAALKPAGANNESLKYENYEDDS
ncbi:hypothetical protein PIB30_059636 [Stylosanthes scabra]|uniref:Uncharacterized protein n=1 Tax=Stylosanthes scabra TaxID=79078 RepID=A0ABU6XK62_9FABA|nr:hypothetical protein [Stylosanthes scabra]